MLPRARCKIACTRLMASPADTMIDEREKDKFMRLWSWLEVRARAARKGIGTGLVDQLNFAEATLWSPYLMAGGRRGRVEGVDARVRSQK